jgi:hypothetical protein
MNKAKYIVFAVGPGEGGFDTPVVFNEVLGHDEVARSLTRVDKVKGAGFCYINSEGRFTCYGRSHTLDRESRKEVDAQVLNRCLGLDGY